MRHRMLLIYNPRAGKGQFLEKLGPVVDMFVKGGYTVEVYPTQAHGDAVDHITNLQPGYELIVAAGGDGTLDEVVTGLMRNGQEIPVGYIPVGSTNDYAASLGLSGDILTAVGDILGGEPVGFDVGCFNDRYFIYVAAFGAFTDVSYSTDQGMKNSLGHFAYLLEATKKLGDVKPFRMQVQVNGHTMTHSYIYGMVTNSFSVGGMKNLLFTDKEVHLSDGMFEVMLIRDPKNLMDLQQIVGAILTRNFDTQLIDIYKTSEISFESPEPLPWTLDGEYGGDDRTVTITNRKEGVRIMLDRGQERPSEEGKADHE